MQLLRDVEVKSNLQLTWFTVHLPPPEGILLRPTISKIAASKAAIPCPETAHVKMTLSKEFPWVTTHSALADGAQSILLITRISGEDDPIALYTHKSISIVIHSSN